MKSRLSATDIDKIETEAIVLLFFSNERPLKGATGLIDWRMNGSISRLIDKGMISGEKGEATLILPNKRIKGKKILMAGLGDSSRFGEGSLKDAAIAIMRQLDKIGIKNFAVAMPPLLKSHISVKDAATTLLGQLVETIETDKLKGSQVFATLAMEKEFLAETRLAIEDLRKGMRGIET
ncbi:MAG: M17 family peptidase N-terminal domain-containing protein [bacterium]|nr:M17 family peptidase N-terminal domain-containing protein [bacterium]